MTRWLEPSTRIRTRPRVASGTRTDLGFYVRSKWEANVARYLKFLRLRGKVYDWEYEPETFYFPIRRGTVSYTPDFKVWDHKDAKPVYWEVKGYMDAKSKTQLNRMARYHPDVQIVLIERDEYRAIAKWSRLIEGWED